jgi:hypothetical protein
MAPAQESLEERPFYFRPFFLTYRRLSQAHLEEAQVGRDSAPWTCRRRRERSLPTELSADPAKVLYEYLSSKCGDSAKELACKAVVLADPIGRLGEIVWLRRSV